MPNLNAAWSGDGTMVVGITFGGILAGMLSLISALSLGSGLAMAALGYMVGGTCGFMLLAACAAMGHDPDVR